MQNIPLEMMTDDELKTVKEACAQKMRRIALLPNPSRELAAAADEARRVWNTVNDLQRERKNS